MPAITNPRVYISNLGNASTDMYRGMYAKYKAVLIHLCAELHSKKLIDSESLRGWGGGGGEGVARFPARVVTKLGRYQITKFIIYNYNVQLSPKLF
jgi:hypothetical protein